MLQNEMGLFQKEMNPSIESWGCEMRFISNENSEHIKYHTVYSAESVTAAIPYFPVHQHILPVSHHMDTIKHKELACPGDDGDKARRATRHGSEPGSGFTTAHAME